MEMENDEKEKRKKAVFDSMSERRRKHIRKIGYEKWDPFQEPKDPIDIRKDKTRRTSQELIREFLQSTDSENYSNDYGRGAFDLCLGIINEEERSIGMFDFACWYLEQLKKEGLR
jgi:hypothetical protein